MNHECENCGFKEEGELLAKGPYNGNLDTRFFCEVCFEEIHSEEE